MILMTDKKPTKETVYFYCVSGGKADLAAYQHLVVCLGEGLKELGIEFYSNVNYWKTSTNDDSYLFQKSTDVKASDCSIVVFDQDWFLQGREFPDFIFHPDRTYKVVYLDCTDGSSSVSWQPKFRKFDLIFRTHYSSQFPHPDNLTPWAFGLSNRILKAIHQHEDEDRNNSMLVNFRDHSVNPHSLRKYCYRNFLPKVQTVMDIDRNHDPLDMPEEGSYDYLMWEQTGRRHYSRYYQRLNQSLACACFGGFFESGLIKDKSSLLNRLSKRLIGELGLHSRCVTQWDSWRLWESFAAGCASIHIDFERYGLVLPEMPENWVHYIGVDFDNIEESIEKISDQPELIKNIAEEGRKWAITHYSPKPTAKRFLDTVLSIV